MVYISTHKSSAALYHIKNMIDNWCQRNPNKKPFVHMRIMEFDEDKRKLVKFDPELSLKDDKSIKLERVEKEKTTTEYKRREYQVESEIDVGSNDTFKEPKRPIKLKSYSTYHKDEVIKTKNRYSILEIEGKDNVIDFAFEESNIESDVFDVIQVTTGDTINHKVAKKLRKSIFYKQHMPDTDMEKEIDKLDGVESFKIIKTSKSDVGVNTDEIKGVSEVIPTDFNIVEMDKLRTLKKVVHNMFVDHSRLLKPSQYYTGSEIGLRYIIKEYESLFK